MNEVWNLEPIYKGFDDPAFAQDLEQLQQLIRRSSSYVKTLSDMEPELGLTGGIQLLEQISELSSRLANYAILRQAADSRDTDAASRVGQVMGIISDTAAPEAAFKAWAAELPELMTLVEKNEQLRAYTFLFSNIQRSSRYLLSGRGEEIAAKLQLSGGNAWSDLQQYLTSTVQVAYRDQKLTLPAVRNLAYDPDPQVRKDAFDAELACYDKIRDAVAFSLNSIKLETLSDCQLRGYASPLARTLEKDNMRQKTLDAMLQAMEEYLPHFHRYLKAKAKALGQEKGLAWYDLFAPMGKTATKFTAESAREYLVTLFAGFDSELSDMVAKAFDEAWIDFYPRQGKTGGAFCANLECLGESRILTNFDGAFTDVVTLAHELGHAFHNQCIRDHRPLNRDYSMPLAETASTFNECVVMAAAIAGAQDKQEKLALLESQLQDATQIICDIYSRYLFEAAVFQRRQDSFMDADTLCSMMRDAQKKAYGDGVRADTLHPYMWVCKSHYYGATFYNYPYAFGGLFARGLYARYAKEGASFVPKYKKLLYTTAVATAEDTAKVAGIDLTDKAFWCSALQTIADQIDQFCQLVEE